MFSSVQEWMYNISRGILNIQYVQIEYVVDKCLLIIFGNNYIF